MQSSQYDPAKEVATFNVVNISQKEITAFSLLVRITSPDGTISTFEHGGDFLPFMIATIEEGHPIAPNKGDGSFAPGASFAMNVPLPQVQVQTVSAIVDVVIYADDTADVLNQQVFASITLTRRGRILGMQKANELLQKALDDANDPHPSITVAAQLKTLAKTTQARGTYEGPGLLDAATNIANAPGATTGRSQKEDDYLRNLLKIHQNRISLYLPHTEVKKVVQP